MSFFEINCMTTGYGRCGLVNINSRCAKTIGSVRCMDGGEREIGRTQAQCGEDGRVCMDGYWPDKGATNDRRETQYLCGSANRFRRLGCQSERVWWWGVGELRGSVHFRTDFGECFLRLTPTAKYNVSAMLPKYVAVKGNRSWEIRWRTGGSDQHSSYFGSTLVESAATSRASCAC